MRYPTVSSFLSCSGRFALAEVGFDCIQVAKDIRQVTRIQIFNAMCTISFENRINYCLTNLGADSSSGVLNVDNPITTFGFCHCLSLLFISASQSRQKAVILWQVGTGSFMAGEYTSLPLATPS
nr:MAG TPA: hypothetical protein [Caudoviricetes sp.]